MWIAIAAAAAVAIAVAVIKVRAKPRVEIRPDSRLEAVAPGWRAADEDLTDDLRARGAYRMWRHGKGHELRVFLMPVPADFSPMEFIARMFVSMEVVGPFGLGAVSGVRFLQNVTCTDPSHHHDGALTSINYAVVTPWNIHLVSAVVPWDEQQPADRRICSLLELVRWT
jgi:hypothetical protein